MRRVPHFGLYKNIAHMARRKTSTNKDIDNKLKCNVEQRTPVTCISNRNISYHALNTSSHEEEKSPIKWSWMHELLAKLGTCGWMDGCALRFMGEPSLWYIHWPLLPPPSHKAALWAE